MCPALNFKAKFAPAVEAGTKCQTIRAPRKDGRAHCKVGDTISLYTDMRRKSCRLLRTATVTRIDDIYITYTRIILNGKILDFGEDDDFAVKDGFTDFQAMADWFNETHGLPFHGAVIHWGPDLAALRIERGQLQAEIDAAPAWGASVSVKQERIDGIDSILAGGA